MACETTYRESMASLVPKARCSGDYDFVEQPPEEYFCPVSFAVLFEPYQTQCCGNLLSKESYDRLQGQPCPVCREENLTANKDKFHRRKVATLKVRCPHKAEGCEWEGELGSLEQHFNSSKQLCAEECQYVDVDCPHSCGERFKRHALQLHMKDCVSFMLAQEVPKLKVIVQEQSEQIKQQEDKIEQLENQIKDQIKQQGDLIKQQGDQIKQQGDQIKQQGDQIKQQGDQIKQQVDLIKQQGDLIKQQGDQIKQQGDQMDIILKMAIPPVSIVMDDFGQCKRNDVDWYSPPFYSHVRGYKMCLNVCANGHGDGEGTHVSVFVCLMMGEFDDDLKWPFSGTFTIQLKAVIYPSLPQYQLTLLLDADDINARAACRKPTEEINKGFGYPQFISHRDLYAGNYLMNNKLVFCISDIAVLST